jgi:hypothetical protein
MCENLPKRLCDLFVNGSSMLVNGIISVSDSPCFYNGPSDGLAPLCISQSLVSKDDCSFIRTNDEYWYDGEKKQLCDDNDVLHGFTCAWGSRSDRKPIDCSRSIFYTDGFDDLLLCYIFYSFVNRRLFCGMQI